MFPPLPPQQIVFGFPKGRPGLTNFSMMWDTAKPREAG